VKKYDKLSLNIDIHKVGHGKLTPPIIQ